MMAHDGPYAPLVEEEPPAAQFIHDVQRRGSGAPSRRGPWLWPPAGQYRRATLLLSVVCLVLLVCLIAVATHRKGVSVSEGEAGEGQTRRQEQEVNVTSLKADLRLLQQENAELRAKLAANANTAPPVARTTAAAAPVATTAAAAAAPVATTAATAAASVATTAAAAPVATTAAAAPVATTAAAAAAAAPVATTAAAAAAGCPAGWLSFQGSCYRVRQRGTDWADAQKTCVRDGGQLAVVRTAQQQSFLWDLLPRGHWNGFWIGLSDRHTEDVWTWVDGTPLEAGFWEEGEPNNHIDEDCVYVVKTQIMHRVAGRSWYDAPCSMSWPYICQRAPGPGPRTPPRGG